jgi:hypothetical protein
MSAASVVPSASPSRTARTAGALYLGVVVAGVAWRTSSTASRTCWRWGLPLRHRGKLNAAAQLRKHTRARHDNQSTDDKGDEPSRQGDNDLPNHGPMNAGWR